MTSFAGKKVQIKVDDVVWREVGDELVVLELSSSTYLNLNGAAKHLWLELAYGATVGELVDSLTERYGIASDQALADSETFLASLSDRDLIIVEA